MPHFPCKTKLKNVYENVNMEERFVVVTDEDVNIPADKTLPENMH